MSARIRVNCDKANLQKIREFVRICLYDYDLGESAARQFVLAVDEACANCMIHQHQCDHSSSIEVNIFKEKNIVYAEIKDTGKAFPIHKHQPEDLRAIVKKRGKGGLGIRIIHEVMDVIKVKEESGFFIYRLGKKLGPIAAAPDAS